MGRSAAGWLRPAIPRGRSAVGRAHGHWAVAHVWGGLGRPAAKAHWAVALRHSKGRALVAAHSMGRKLAAKCRELLAHPSLQPRAHSAPASPPALGPGPRPGPQTAPLAAPALGRARPRAAAVNGFGRRAAATCSAAQGTCCGAAPAAHPWPPDTHALPSACSAVPALAADPSRPKEPSCARLRHAFENPPSPALRGLRSRGRRTAPQWRMQIYANHERPTDITTYLCRSAS